MCKILKCLMIVSMCFVANSVQACDAGATSGGSTIDLDRCIHGVSARGVHRLACLVSDAYTLLEGRPTGKVIEHYGAYADTRLEAELDPKLAVGDEVSVDGLGAETAVVESILPEDFGFRVTVDDKVIVAIRGTANFKDWIRDMHKDRIVLEQNGVRGGRHGGFSEAYGKINSDIIRIWSDVHKSRRGQLIFAGHSLGAALAEQAYVTSCFLAQRVKTMRVDGLGLGVPHVYDNEFSGGFYAKMYDAAAGGAFVHGRFTTINAEGDWVPDKHRWYAGWSPVPLGRVYDVPGVPDHPSLLSRHSVATAYLPSLAALAGMDE